MFFSLTVLTVEIDNYALFLTLKGGIMAKPIKETPVLTGKDAARFTSIIKANESKKVPAQDYERARKAFENFKMI